MNWENIENEGVSEPAKHTYLQLYLIILILLICSRLFDIYTTYLATPDLSEESNFMVRYLGLGWLKFIVINIIIILVFFFLFRISWSKLIAEYQKEQWDSNHNPNESNNYLGLPIVNKSIKSHAKHRNIFLEIGLTLPIYVIITGYFQGVINIMIHLELIVISFTSFIFLYPIIIGFVFGYISLYLTKQLLYFRHPLYSKKVLKFMMAKKIVKQ
ncbi:MAG: hypothetical protein JSW00_13165 [Thermoplasmata archaeon]|nr:MAG: hypothetical protein JSW00_13165 [Thermoplasmata archaeon]